MFKLKFWKHNDSDDLKLDSDLDKDIGVPPTPDFTSVPQQTLQTNFPQADAHKDQMLQLISSKLDTLIAKMDNMNQRIANLERIAQEAQQ